LSHVAVTIVGPVIIDLLTQQWPRVLNNGIAPLATKTTSHHPFLPMASPGLHSADIESDGRQLIAAPRVSIPFQAPARTTFECLTTRRLRRTFQLLSGSSPLAPSRSRHRACGGLQSRRRMRGSRGRHTRQSMRSSGISGAPEYRTDYRRDGPKTDCSYDRGLLASGAVRQLSAGAPHSFGLRETGLMRVARSSWHLGASQQLS
jgi:hypothetical protein